MARRTRFGQFCRNQVAAFLALVLLWISTGGAIHTDSCDFDGCLLYRTHHSAQLAAHPTPPSICPACEWQQTFSVLPDGTIGIATLPIDRIAFSMPLVTAMHLVAFGDVPLRGPPARF